MPEQQCALPIQHMINTLRQIKHRLIQNQHVSREFQFKNSFLFDDIQRLQKENSQLQELIKQLDDESDSLKQIIGNPNKENLSQRHSHQPQKNQNLQLIETYVTNIQTQSDLLVKNTLSLPFSSLQVYQQFQQSFTLDQLLSLNEKFTDKRKILMNLTKAKQKYEKIKQVKCKQFKKDNRTSTSIKKEKQ